MQKIKFGIAMTLSFFFGPVLAGMFGVCGLLVSLAGGSSFSMAGYSLPLWSHVVAIVVGYVIGYPAMTYCEIITLGKDPEVRMQRIREDMASW